MTMNKQTEALKMAIVVMQAFDNELPTNSAKEAIQACKEALEQPATPKNCTSLDEYIAELEKDADFKELMKQKRAELLALFELEQPAQEPVAWMAMDLHTSWLTFQKESVKDAKEIIPLYTHPAPSWQGISDDERHEVIVKHVAVDCTCDPYEFARAIEAKLKEKNT